MRTLFIFLFIHFISAGQDLQCFSANGKYGFKRGNEVVIKPQYEYADHFYFGRAAVQLNKKWGFIDESGKMIIQPKYIKVEHFSEGYAKFYENGLFGLLDEQGKEVISAKCVAGARVKGCYVYQSGKKYGWISADNKVVIDPIYDQVDVADYFVQADKDGSVDIFNTSGEMIAASAYGYSLILLENSSSRFVDARWSYESRILNEAGELVGPVYSDLEVLTCATYSSFDSDGFEYYHDRLIKCNIAPGNGPYTGAFHMILYNGRIYNDTDYFNFASDGDRTTVEENKLTYELDQYGGLVKTRYKKIQELNDCVLFSLMDGTGQIAQLSSFAADTTIIATFGSVEPLFTPEPYDRLYNDSEEDWNYTTTSSYYQNIVEVEGLNENRGKFALYQLDNKQVITPFEPFRRDVLVSEDYTRNYIYRNALGLIGATLNGEHFPFKFESYQDYSYLGFLFLDTLGRQYFYSTLSKKMFEIPENVTIIWSQEIAVQNTNEVDSSEGEGGEIYYYDYAPPRFTESFMMLQKLGENSKYGFIDGQGEYVSPQFDSISDHTDGEEYNGLYPIFCTYLNGKYGAYDFFGSSQVPPTYSSPLSFTFSDLVNLMVCTFDKLGYYLTTDNKKISSEALEPRVEKKGKLVGLTDYSFYDSDKTVTIIPFLYKEIKTEFADAKIAIAKGQNNKWGVLSLINGDTLLPFEYTEILFTQNYYSTSEMAIEATWFKTFKGKKVGLYVPKFGRWIPAVYDRIEMDEIEAGFGSVNALYTFIGDKVGVYSDDLREVLPCEFDGIVAQPNPSEIFFYAQKGNKNFAFNWSYGLYPITTPKYQYDLVIEQIGMRKTDRGYDCFEIGTDQFIGKAKDTLSFGNENLAEFYQPFIQNGMLGIQSKDTGEIVIAPEHKMLVFLDDYYLLEFKKGETYYRNIESPKKTYKFMEY